MNTGLEKNKTQAKMHSHFGRTLVMLHDTFTIFSGVQDYAQFVIKSCNEFFHTCIDTYIHIKVCNELLITEKKILGSRHKWGCY